MPVVVSLCKAAPSGPSDYSSGSSFRLLTGGAAQV